MDERGLGFGDDGGVAFGLAQFDEFAVIGGAALEFAELTETLFEPGALAHHFLGARAVLPQLGIFGGAVQFGETRERGVVVKDASAAAAAIR